MSYNELSEKVFQALGTASVCWENMDGTGIFDSEQAKRVGNELLEWIDSNYKERGPEEALLGLATTEELFNELVARIGQPLDRELGFSPARDRVYKLAFMLGSLNPVDREYRTVGPSYGYS